MIVTGAPTAMKSPMAGPPVWATVMLLLRHVYLYDRAGNTTYLTSDKFGGSTDFSTMFPTTVITLTP